jgi:xylose dehydrogenase (NAD/NADP)
MTGDKISKFRWGILGASRFALTQTIPSMKRAPHCEILSIASRSFERARAAAKPVDISNAYGSHEQVLADPNNNALYIPLPNHLHVLWSRKVLAANKHVLCEKPIAMAEFRGR